MFVVPYVWISPAFFFCVTIFLDLERIIFVIVIIIAVIIDANIITIIVYIIYSYYCYYVFQISILPWGSILHG